MKKMFKTVASLALGCALLSTSAFAALDGSVVERENAAGTFDITVKKEGATAWESTILVLKAGSVDATGAEPVIASTVNDGDIYYINQTSAKSDTATYSIAETTEKLYVFAGGSDETAAKFLGDIDANIPATGLTLEAEGLTATEEGADYDYTAALTVEDVMNITATVAPETATDKTVVWSASNENATVVDGVVTAVAAGDVVITAKVGDVTKTIAITISEKAVEPTAVYLPSTDGAVEGVGSVVTKNITAVNQKWWATGFKSGSKKVKIVLDATAYPNVATDYMIDVVDGAGNPVDGEEVYFSKEGNFFIVLVPSAIAKADAGYKFEIKQATNSATVITKFGNIKTPVILNTNDVLAILNATRGSDTLNSNLLVITADVDNNANINTVDVQTVLSKTRNSKVEFPVMK